MNNKEVAGELMRCMNQFRLLNRKYHLRAKLPPAEFFMMVEIKQFIEEKQQEGIIVEGITTTQLVKLLDVSLSAVSKIMRVLEEKELIERIACPKDRRITYIRLSEKGNSILESSRKHHEELMSKVINKVGTEHMEQMLITLHSMYTYLSQELEEKND